MQNKYELIVENVPEKPNYFYLLTCSIILSLLFIITFLYNFAFPIKITPIYIHQKCEHENSANYLEIREKNDILERQMEKGLVEFYYSLQNVVQENKIDDQIIRLMAISRELSKGNEEWHKNELSKLGKQIQQKLKKLQNPLDCRKARLLLIKWEKRRCGFGCIMHFVSYGLVIAAASNRVLIIENDGDELLCENGWNGIFEPITKCKFAESIGTNITLAHFPIYSAPNQKDRIVWMPSRWQFWGFREIEHMPPIVPNELMEFLQKHHPNPPAWFLGQFIYYLWRPNPSILEYINKAKKRIHFKDDQPIVGIHVRRTDKNKEARYYSLDEYIKWTQHWFDVEEKRIELEGENGLKKHKRRLFIASDEPTVILDARQRFDKHFQINAFDKHSKIAQNMENRFSTMAIKGMMAEIEMLIRCNFVVCTFSSNVCRLIYELMQALDGNAGNRVKSLDAFYDDWFYDHHMEAIEDYLAPNSSVMKAKKGDIFAISQVLWNGFVSARNMRTAKVGHFPTFLLKDNLKNASFPIFSEFILY